MTCTLSRWSMTMFVVLEQSGAQCYIVFEEITWAIPSVYPKAVNVATGSFTEHTQLYKGP